MLIVRTLLACLIISCLAACQSSEKLPNFIIIFCDDLGYGDIGPYGNTVHLCMALAQKLQSEGHSVEVFDLRSIKPMDVEGICASVEKTGKALVVHEDHEFISISSEVIAVINERCFTSLDAPCVRVAAKNIPVGFAKPLEQDILPQTHDIEEKLRELLAF